MRCQRRSVEPPQTVCQTRTTNYATTTPAGVAKKTSPNAILPLAHSLRYSLNSLRVKRVLFANEDVERTARNVQYVGRSANTQTATFAASTRAKNA